MVTIKRNTLRHKSIHTSRYLILLILMLILVHSFANKATASEINAEDKRIYDEAGILSSYEIEELETTSHDYGDTAGIEIFVLTHNNKNATYPEKYIEDFEDQLPVADRVYFLYDVYRGEIFMESYGLAETYIHSKRIDIMFDNVVDYIKSGYYYDAFKTYITMSADYMADDSELNYDYDYQGHYRKEDLKNNILLNFWFQLFVALAIGGIVVGSLAYHSSGRMTAGSSDYLDRSRGGLIGRRDQYLRSSVVRWRKPQQNTSSSSGGSRGGFNSGGFRGGTSSGGRSHSSGGRKL